MRTAFTQKTALHLNPTPIIHRIDTPDLAHWKQKVKGALSKINRKEMDKVILARRMTLLYKDGLNPFDIVRRLQDKIVHATLFIFQPSPHLTFIGATPEKLYSRKGLSIQVEAVARTYPLGKKGLLNNKKARREFDFVKQFIQSELSPCCTVYNWKAEDRIIFTTAVQHLYNPFNGKLKTV